MGCSSSAHCSSSVPATPRRAVATPGPALLTSKAVSLTSAAHAKKQVHESLAHERGFSGPICGPTNRAETLEQDHDGPVLGRGFGDLICGVNHIALIVRDVGDALFFYTDIIGFRQVRRPNFDRHGAWLRMGNIQLHLIKGVPHTHRGQHPRDLIVSHIALAVKDIDAVLARLKKLKAEKYSKLHWRQNVSVPTYETSSKEIFESNHCSSDGKLTQFFLEDPDGYWLEFCDCAEDEERGDIAHKQRMRELAASAKVQFRFPHAAKMAVLTFRWARRARCRLACKEEVERELAELLPVATEAVEQNKLRSFCLRRNTYGDICQGFNDEQLQSALAEAGNNVPGAVLVLKRWRQQEHGQVYEPPAFLDDEGRIMHTHPFRMDTAGRRTVWM